MASLFSCPLISIVLLILNPFFSFTNNLNTPLLVYFNEDPIMRMKRSDNNDKDSDNNPNSSFVPHPACAACKHQRRKCDNKCLLHPYFPADKATAFQAVHKVYGVSNVSKMIISVREGDRNNVANSLVWEAMWRTRDPVFGSFGVCQRLQEQLACHKKLILKQAAQLKQLTTSNLIGWNSINNGGIGSGNNCGGQAIDVSNNTAISINYGHDNDVFVNPSLYNCPTDLQILENLQEKEAGFVGPVQQDIHDDFNHPQFFFSGALKDGSEKITRWDDVV